MREILVIADQEGGKQAAFHHALEIAKNTGTIIEFVGFVHAPGVDSSEILTQDEKKRVHHKYIDQKQAQIDDFLNALDLSGVKVKVKVDVVWEKSFDRWVIARCDQKSFDMVFKSGNRTEAFLHTPSDWQLMRYCPDPVMIVGEQPWKEGGKVLVALDLGSSSSRTLELNENLLRQGIKLAKATNSEVHTCYSIAVPKALADLDLIDPKAYEEKMKGNLDPFIRKLVDEAGLDRSRLHLLSGRPAKEICRISQKIKADVVLVGNKTQTSLRGRLLGNTAETVLHKVSADVVVIK